MHDAQQSQYAEKRDTGELLESRSTHHDIDKRDNDDNAVEAIPSCIIVAEKVIRPTI